MMRISCIIPAHNEELLIGGCIDSIIENSNRRLLEIIVVDNASSDQTGNIARQRANVRVIREERKGLCYARERGRLEAAGDFFAFIDADCRMPPGWIDFVEAYFQQNTEVVCLSGPPVYYDGSERLRLLLRTLWRASAPVAYYAVGYMVYGAHFVVKRQALEAIGGFSTSIEFYGEDTDVAKRLRTAGKVAFCMSFRIATSARRFQTQGLVTTCARYGLNFLWPVVFGKPFSTHHVDIR
jgi:glycosyltransferase involved in cell wall biosynthesis